jgi:predicted nuclease with TOPRIM domain
MPEMEYKSLNDIEPDIAITEQVAELQKKVSSLKCSTCGLVESKNTLQAELDGITQKLNIKNVNNIYRAEIVKLEQQRDKCLDELFEVQAKIDKIDAYNKARIDLNTAKINSMFDSVQFQLYKENLVGTTEECCIARNKKGVKIANTNTAEKIQAGLEIIRVLSDNAGLSVPIFIDNRESISVIPQMNCQIINLYKTNDNQINISYE